MTDNTSADGLREILYKFLSGRDELGYLSQRNTDETVAAITSYIKQRELEARIDEARKIYNNYIPSGTLVGKAVLKRIKRYKAERAKLGGKS